MWKQKEICDTATAAMTAGTKTLHLLWNIFFSCIENAAFVWVQHCLKNCLPSDSHVIQEKTKSSYDNLKQKKVKELELENLI